MIDKKISILVIEDDSDDAFLFDDFLSASSFSICQKKFTENLSQAQEFLRKNKADIIFLDLSLPDAREFEGLKQLLNEFSNTNIIILTGLSSEEYAIEAVRLGACDYLVKGKIDSKLLEKTIIFSLERHNMSEKLKLSQRSEALSELAAGIAHNLTNKLSVMEILLYNGKTKFGHIEGLNEWIESLENVKDRCVAMNRKVMQFSQHKKKKIERISLSQTLEGNRAVFGALLGKGIDLEITAHEDAFIKVDPEELDQAFMNLLINAKEAMDGQGKVNINCFSRSDENGREVTHIQVEDSGQGIEEKYLQNILEPFFSTKSCGLGTGLGLPTVYAFVKQSDGEMTVESSVGKGAKFNIILPSAL